MKSKTYLLGGLLCLVNLLTAQSSQTTPMIYMGDKQERCQGGKLVEYNILCAQGNAAACANYQKEFDWISKNCESAGFGAKAADKDRDGVPDNKDECPTEAGNVNGCPDSDRDGVIDKKDDCPNTAGNVNGCPDSDRDGIIDKKDECPSEAGNVNGCPDSDGDGVVDKKDECPNTAGNVNGCPDSDGDGIIDIKDGCPNVKGNVNGCPDSDGDGIIDIKDGCPNVKGNVNGCPDSDGDGIIDSKDSCPNAAGNINGCPDEDQDGVPDNQDKCPSEAGSTRNGCPPISSNALQVGQESKKKPSGPCGELKRSIGVEMINGSIRLFQAKSYSEGNECYFNIDTKEYIGKTLIENKCEYKTVSSYYYFAFENNKFDSIEKRQINFDSFKHANNKWESSPNFNEVDFIAIVPTKTGVYRVTKAGYHKIENWNPLSFKEGESIDTNMQKQILWTMAYLVASDPNAQIISDLNGFKKGKVGVIAGTNEFEDLYLVTSYRIEPLIGRSPKKQNHLNYMRSTKTIHDTYSNYFQP